MSDSRPWLDSNRPLSKREREKQWALLPAGQATRAVSELLCMFDRTCQLLEAEVERLRAGNVEYHRLMCRAAELPETAQPGDIVEKIEALVEDLENLDHVCR